jgi:hypothetical protein
LPIATGIQQEDRARFMPHLAPRLSLGLLAALLPLTLGACADTLTTKETASSATLQRDYDKTLTKAEQKAAIDDMSASAKKNNPAAADQTASTEAKPAE